MFRQKQDKQPKRRVKYLVTIPFFALLLGLVIFGSSPSIYAVDEYSCGTYSADDYGSTCPDTMTPEIGSGSTGSGTSTGTTGESDTSTDTTTQPDTTTDIDGSSDTILLNEFSQYLTSTGKTLDLKQDQVVYFLVNGEKHSITVKTITPDYIIITIASTPTDVTIQKGETVKRDVNGDGIDDISISYLNSTDTGVSLNFVQLSGSKTDQTAMAGNNLLWLWIVLAGLGIIGIVIAIIVSKKKNKLT